MSMWSGSPSGISMTPESLSSSLTSLVVHRASMLTSSVCGELLMRYMDRKYSWPLRISRGSSSSIPEFGMMSSKLSTVTASLPLQAIGARTAITAAARMIEADSLPFML